MNKVDVVALLADNLGVSRKKAEVAYEALVEAIRAELAKGEKVALAGLGVFEVRNRVARNGRNPRTGEEITVPSQKTPAFRAGKLLKEAVNK